MNAPRRRMNKHPARINPGMHIIKYGNLADDIARFLFCPRVIYSHTSQDFGINGILVGHETHTYMGMTLHRNIAFVGECTTAHHIGLISYWIYINKLQIEKLHDWVDLRPYICFAEKPRHFHLDV